MRETGADAATLRPVLRKAVEQLPTAVRYRAQNAFDGFERAKALLPIDREMASFRAITAAEEAASALIRSLQLRDYPSATSIDLRKHPHKAAVPFFLDAVRRELARDGKVNLTIVLAADPPKMTVALPINQFGVFSDDIQNLQIQLDDPLGIVGTRVGVEENDFFDQAVKKAAGSRKVDKLIASEANARNRILYAHDSGLPKSQVTLQGIEVRERGAMLCLYLAVAVLQVEHHQSFALQCLAGFLKVIGRQPLDGR